MKQTEAERKAAYELNKKLKVGYGDCLHMYCAKEAGAIAISPDRHWRKIGEVVGVKVLSPKEFI